ncbi:hypothetical protein H8F10_12905 [Vibrio fluvialis]|uniref:hypothetical protein n=1 Tax=Vibrio fluvialis TaxID=676 RepID=UPI00192B7BDB|nr:hypothetical protein [Vibrio fluvialis]MBL4278815.1 hypothetical protein [Vibrio fluvialis]
MTSETVTLKKLTRCSECNRYKTEASQKKIGDQVEYMDVTTSRRGSQFTSKKGKITFIDINSVVVKGLGRAGSVRVPVDELRDPDGATSVSAVMFGECCCNNSETKNPA